jgi:ParB/RepB/Spo0J family partition protein
MDAMKLNDRQAPAEVGPELKPKTTPPELLLLDLDLLDDNPYQPRSERDESMAAQLRESIATQGQVQAILVRRAGTRWQIIFGHGRVEALRRLRNEATSEADRRRFSTVKAEERFNVSDEQMLVLALLENVQREDISPLDCAAALMRLRAMHPEMHAIEEIAREVGISPDRVKRLLRLHAAPQVIKDAVSKGINVRVEADPDEDSSETSPTETMETRRLEVYSALEFAKLHTYWSSTPEVVSTEGTADERIAALIQQALKQEWSVRRVQTVVAKLIRGEADSPKPNERAPFNASAKKVVIYHSRLSEMNEAQKAELRSVLEPIWNQLGWQAQRSPGNGFAQWLSGLRSAPAHLKELFRAWRALRGAMQGHFKALPDVPPPPREKPVALLPKGNPAVSAKPLSVDRAPIGAPLPVGNPGAAAKPPVDRAPISPP